MTGPPPELTRAAPRGSIDMAFEGYEIPPCPDCRSWTFEIVTDVATGGLVCREWHAVDCPLFADLLRDRALAEDRI